MARLPYYIRLTFDARAVTTIVLEPEAESRVYVLSATCRASDRNCEPARVVNILARDPETLIGISADHTVHTGCFASLDDFAMNAQRTFYQPERTLRESNIRARS